MNTTREASLSLSAAVFDREVRESRVLFTYLQEITPVSSCLVLLIALTCLPLLSFFLLLTETVSF